MERLLVKSDEYFLVRSFMGADVSTFRQAKEDLLLEAKIFSPTLVKALIKEIFYSKSAGHIKPLKIEVEASRDGVRCFFLHPINFVSVGKAVSPNQRVWSENISDDECHDILCKFIDGDYLWLKNQNWISLKGRTGVAVEELFFA